MGGFCQIWSIVEFKNRAKYCIKRYSYSHCEKTSSKNTINSGNTVSQIQYRAVEIVPMNP